MQPTRGPLQALAHGAVRFLEWWRDELRELVPQPVRRLLSGARPALVLAALEDGYAVFEERGSRVRPLRRQNGAPLTRAEAVAALGGALRSFPRHPVGVRIPAVACYARAVELPAGARGDFARILEIDLERATPFRRDDVYIAHIADETGQRRGKVQVLQLVAKRSIIDPLLADLESLGRTAAFVDCWRDRVSPGLAVDFLPEPPASRDRRRRVARLARWLAAIALVLAASASYLAVSKHEAALERVRAETAAMKGKAAAVGRLMERANAAVLDLAQLQQAKLEQVPSLLVVEELSRMLPDTVWLTDLRIERNFVELAGLAKSGAALPGLFSRSSLFAEATLTAPLTLDAREDKERFSLRARLEPRPAAPAQAGRGAER